MGERLHPKIEKERKKKGARRKGKRNQDRAVERSSTLHMLQDPDRAGIRQRDREAGTRLLLRLLDFGAGSGHFALGHVASETTDVVL